MKKGTLCFSNRQKGLSTLETLIAIGVLSIVAFGFLGWATLSYKGLGNVNENFEITNAMGRLKGAFGDDDTFCTQILGGRSPDQPIDVIYYYDAHNGKLLTDRPIFQVGQPVEGSRGGVNVKSMQLKTLSDLMKYFDPNRNPAPGASVIVGDLEVVFEKSSGLGPQEVTRRIPLYVTLQSGKVKSCSPSPLGSIQIGNAVCGVQADGYSYYNPDKAQPNSDPNAPQDFCWDLPAVQWVSGATPDKASCPANMKVAISPDHTLTGPATVVCRAQTAPGSYIPPRSYKSGFVDSDSAYAFEAQYDSATQTCNFKFQEGIDPSSFKSQIKCIDAGF